MARTRPWIYIALLAGLAWTSSASQARDLIYRPISPGFGGSPLNTQYVFGTADRTKDPAESRSSGRSRNPIDTFTSTLQARLLAQVSDQIVDAIFGEGASDEGRFQVGDTVIEFARGDTVVTLTISDIVSGSVTTIDVPLPQL